MADTKFRNKIKKNKKNILRTVANELVSFTKKIKDKYHYGLGRRKTATARVRLYPSPEIKFNINGKTLEEYFVTDELRKVATEAMTETGLKFLVTVMVKGGGKSSQAEAIRLGISRAMLEIDPELRSELKTKGYLKRDPRSVERKKPGLKKARRATQWRKR